LALRWLHSHSNRYPDGQLYADLAATTAPQRRRVTDVLGRFLRSLGVPAERVPLDVEGSLNLVPFRDGNPVRRGEVDNATTSSDVRALIPASPCCTVVVASRFRLAGWPRTAQCFVPLEPLGWTPAPGCWRTRWTRPGRR